MRENIHRICLFCVFVILPGVEGYPNENKNNQKGLEFLRKKGGNIAKKTLPSPINTQGLSPMCAYCQTALGFLCNQDE